MSNHFHIGRSDLKKFPNNFSFGGVTGYAVVLAEFLPFSVSTINFVISMALIVIGFIFLGRSFGALTAYSSVLVYFFKIMATISVPPLEAPTLKRTAEPKAGSAIA